MVRWLKRFGLLLGLLLIAFVLFFFWASSGTLAEDERAVVTSYASDYAPPGDTLTVMTYNIGYLSGMTNNEPVDPPESLFTANMAAAVELLRRSDPDVIGFQEIDFGASRSYRIHQLDTLARRLDYPASAQAVNWDVRYLPFPYHWNPAIHFGRVLSGQAVLSRYPIRSHEGIALQGPSQPFWREAFYLERLAQVDHLDVGEPLILINVHLEAFDEATRERQAREVRALVQCHASKDVPLLLIGDFNAPVPAAKTYLSPEMKEEFADDETIALLLEGTDLQAALPDSTYRRFVRPFGTFPADAPNRGIDHIFYSSSHFEALETHIQCGPPDAPPSDHCAVVARLALKK